MGSVKRGLFINNKKAKDSIYESGYMVYQCLKLSDQYVLDYREVDIDDRAIETGYDFYFFNYHPVTMGWLQTRPLKKTLGFVITMILEVAPGDAFVFCPERHFSLYCALDPTIKSTQKNLYAFPRPLEKVDFVLPEAANAIPVIGTFGFATRGKGFQHVVEAVNKEFDRAIVKVNIPYGNFVADSKEYAMFLSNLCKEKAKPGIDVQVTHDFMHKDELIRWCASNTLNCFLYDRNMPGLAATTDQAIVSGRPLSVSDNDTFRHITQYLPPYPGFSLKDSISKSTPMVQAMQKDWAPARFTERFEKILFENLPTGNTISGMYQLPVKTKNLRDSLSRKYKKYTRKLARFRLSKLFIPKRSNEII